MKAMWNKKISINVFAILSRHQRIYKGHRNAHDYNKYIVYYTISMWSVGYYVIIPILAKDQCQINSTSYSLTVNCLFGIFTHLKLRLADAIHNFKSVKIIQV